MVSRHGTHDGCEDAMIRSSLPGLTRMTYQTVASADGTSIAYEVFGTGPPLIAVCGATCDRALMRATAQALGRHFTTVDYDRRGRGDSGDTPPRTRSIERSRSEEHTSEL